MELKEETNNILDLGFSLSKIQREIPKGLQDDISNEIFSKILDKALSAQYFVNRLNEYCRSNYEFRLVNLRDKSDY